MIYFSMHMFQVFDVALENFDVKMLTTFVCLPVIDDAQ